MTKADPLEFTPPGPGSRRQDRAHMTFPVTRIAQHLVPPGFMRGFNETFETYGVPVQSVTQAVINDYVYLRMQFPGTPGPDGIPTEEETGAFIGRCLAAAEKAIENKTWRHAIEEWDAEYKPRAVARHLELGDVDLTALDDTALAEHLAACFSHHTEMVYQHHRFNVPAIFPVGDLLLQTMMLTGTPPHMTLGLFEGASPLSGTWSEEIGAAATALAADPEAMAQANDVSRSPAERVSALRERIPEVDAYVRNVHMRLADGFDVDNPTVGEAPELLLGKLLAAAEAGEPARSERVAALEADIRSKVPAEQQAHWDELVAEARLVYRLRDERGIYSDMPAIGLTRLALLELGHRLVARGGADAAEHAFGLEPAEALDLAKGVAGPDAAELRRRAESRERAAAAKAPPFLGDPPPPPPPPDALPPALARMAGAVGFAIEAILGEVEDPSTEGDVVGMPGSGGVYEGRARLISDTSELSSLEDGDVLVARSTGEAFNCAVHLLGAIVTDHGGVASHAAIISREVGIPAVVGTVTGTQRIKDGDRIRVDGNTGRVTVLA